MILAGAIILAYMFYPIYKWLVSKIKIKWLSSLLVILLLIFLISVPIVMMLHALVEQAGNVYSMAADNIDYFMDCADDGTFSCVLKEQYSEIFGSDYLEKTVSSIAEKLSQGVYGMLSSLPGKILELFIMVFLMFFLIMEGRKVFKITRGLLPMQLKHERYIMNRLKATTHAVVYGQLIVAAIQGFLGGIGFAILGLPNPILWGTLMGFLALIPFLGTTLVWLPAGVIMILHGWTSGQYLSWVGPGHSVLGGIIMLCYGFLIVSSIDNVLRPLIVGEGAKLHPALVLLGVLGGLKIFGIIGIALGPIVLGVLITFIDIYELEKAHALNGQKKISKTKKRKRKR